jgi:hypothetical protein
MSRFEILEESTLTLDEIATQKKSDMSDFLKQKWNQVKQAQQEG